MMDSGQSGRRLAWSVWSELQAREPYITFAFLRSSIECSGNLQTVGNSRYHSVKGLFNRPFLYRLSVSLWRLWGIKSQIIRSDSALWHWDMLWWWREQGTTCTLCCFDHTPYWRLVLIGKWLWAIVNLTSWLLSFCTTILTSRYVDVLESHPFFVGTARQVSLTTRDPLARILSCFYVCFMFALLRKSLFWLDLNNIKYLENLWCRVTS